MKGYKAFNKKMIFTNPLGKRGAVASLGGGATTKSKTNETGGIANHSMCYHNQGFRDCNTPLKSQTEKYLNQGGVNKLW